MPCFAVNSRRPRRNSGRRVHVAALALNGLHEDRRHVRRVGQALEDGVGDVAQALQTARGPLLSVGAAEAVGVGDVDHALHQRGKVLAVDGLAAGKGHGAVGAAVEGAQEGDDAAAPRPVAHQLQGALQGLGARVAQEDALLAPARHQAGHALGQVHLRLIVKVGAGKVQEPLGLLLDRLHHVPDGSDRWSRRRCRRQNPAGGCRRRPTPSIRGHGQRPPGPAGRGCRREREPGVAGNGLARLGAGQRGPELDRH